MRRRLVRLVLAAVLLPAASRGAELLANRLEAAGPPTIQSRSLRRVARIIDRRRRRGRWRRH